MATPAPAATGPREGVPGDQAQLSVDTLDSTVGDSAGFATRLREKSLISDGELVVG